MPPIAPPRLSISTVANIATKPAITEESNIPPESMAMKSTHLLSNLWINSAFFPEVGIPCSERMDFNSFTVMAE